MKLKETIVLATLAFSMFALSAPVSPEEAALAAKGWAYRWGTGNGEWGMGNGEWGD